MIKINFIFFRLFHFFYYFSQSKKLSKKDKNNNNNTNSTRDTILKTFNDKMNQDDGTISEKEFKIISKIASKDEINVLINELSVTQDEDEEDGRYSINVFFFSS